MPIVEDIRTTITKSTPAMAVVGVTDLAVERVRHLQAEVNKTVAALDPSSIDPKAVTATVQQAPAQLVAKALEVAGDVQEQVTSSVEGLAGRGRSLVNRIADQRSTKELVKTGRSTISRGKAAVTTARRAVDDTTIAAKSLVTVGRREAGEVAGELEKSVADTEKVVAARTRGTKSAAKRTVTTARTRAASTRSASKGAVTSAKKAASAASKAAGDAAAKVGD